MIEQLETQGFHWFSHYSSVDCLHDVYGLEVCGIRERDDAAKILTILARMFPDWKPGRFACRNQGREPGWKVKISRDRERPRKRWLEA